MKLFIKLKCADKQPVIDKLEEMAYNRDQICIINPNMLEDMPEEYRQRTRALQSAGGPAMAQGITDWALGYFNRHEGVHATEERCSKIVSRSGEELEDHDFLFEFIEEPEEEQVEELKRDVKVLLEDLECENDITLK